MNKAELKLLQNYPLDLKIEKTKLRIREWYEHYNGEVYVSFSGGKDSTVLLHIVRTMYPEVEAVFSNTGLEFPEIIKFVKSFDNVTIIKPKITFKKVIEEKGYPIISKSVSNCVRLARQNIADGKDTLRVRQIKGLEKGSIFNKGKWEFLLDAPFKISEQCCDELKKKPIKEFNKKSGKVPFIATMASEGGVRKDAYLKTGCNAYNIGKSQPLGFWTEQDILEYIVRYNLNICSVYGEIIKDSTGLWTTTGEKRTGCMFCTFGVQFEKYPNRYQRLQYTHPKQYEFMLNKLGFKQVFDYIGIDYIDKQKRLF